MEFKKNKNIVFSSSSLKTTSEYVDKIKKRNYNVRSACNGMDILGILISSSRIYDLALLELDVLVEPLEDMNRKKPYMFPKCEEKNLAGLVKIIKNHNKGIKVVGFSKRPVKHYVGMETGMDEYILELKPDTLELKLNTYIKNGFNL